MKNKTKLFAIGLLSAGALVHVIHKVRKKSRSENMIIISDDNSDIDDKLRLLLSQGKKIRAIKEAKHDLHLNLRDAKKYVEQL